MPGNEQPTVVICREPEAEGLPLPAYATEGAAGMDLAAAIIEPVTLLPGARALISTGLRIGLPPGYEGQIRPRSGLAIRHGIGLVNAPGTLDSDYTGVVQVILINWGAEPYIVQRGDRIAQLVVAPVCRVRLVEATELDRTTRGTGGFGSTGAGQETL
jgi:dUTP pyrophosphatase